MKEFAYYRSKKEVALFVFLYFSLFAPVPAVTLVYLGTGTDALQIAVYGTLAALGIPFTILLRSFSPKVVIGEEAIAVNSGLEKAKIDLDAIEKTTLRDRLPAVLLHTDDRWLPVVINTLTKSWTHMARTLVERMPDDVDVVDPENVIRTPKPMSATHVRERELEPFTPNETMLIGLFGASPILLAIVLLALGGPPQLLAGIIGIGLGFAIIGQGSRARRKADANTDRDDSWTWDHLARVTGWFGVALLSWLASCSILL